MTTKEEKKSNVKGLTFDISCILSFVDYEQDFVFLKNVPILNCNSRKAFLNYVFEKSKLKYGKLVSLWAISCCQNMKSKNEMLIPILKETNGKFCFLDGIADEDDLDIKDSFLNAVKSKRKKKKKIT